MLDKVENYCRKLLGETRCQFYTFHNLQHTIEVVENVIKIAKWKNLNKSQSEIIQIAAWFHDTGYSVVYEGHEEVSKTIATNFLKQNEVDEKLIEKICGLIDATKMPQKPNDEYERILCDADLMHLGTLDFFCKNIFLRREWESFADTEMLDEEWYQANVKFLENHVFKTDYGNEILSTGLRTNLETIKELLVFYQKTY